MTPIPLKLSDTARAMLTLAASREGRLVRPPQLPIAAARQVVRSMLNNGLVEEVPFPTDDAAYPWREAEDGAVLVLRATNQGLAAIARVAEDQQAADATQPETATESPTAPHTAVSDVGAAYHPRAIKARPEASQAPTRANLRQAVQAVLEVWSNAASRAPTLDQPMAALRLALGERAPRATGVDPHKPRKNTKQAQVLAILRRPEGATVAQIAEAMGWAPHTVRGFFAGLKTRHGITVEAAERVRQVGPNHQGAKGSYTIYRIAEAG